MRLASGRAGMVVVCQGAEPGLGLLNAEQFRKPHGCPALHVAALPRAEPTRLVSYYERTPTEARNVVVTIPGRDRSRRPVVVMTPRSSWWHSTSERGGGLVCWLETLRALLAEPPANDVVLTANSGHELGHLGLDCFWTGGRDGIGRTARSGCITAPTSARPAANCRSSRPTDRYAKRCARR